MSTNAEGLANPWPPYFARTGCSTGAASLRVSSGVSTRPSRAGAWQRASAASARARLFPRGPSTLMPSRNAFSIRPRSPYARAAISCRRRAPGRPVCRRLGRPGRRRGRPCRRDRGPRRRRRGSPASSSRPRRRESEHGAAANEEDSQEPLRLFERAGRRRRASASDATILSLSPLLLHTPPHERRVAFGRGRRRRRR